MRNNLSAKISVVFLALFGFSYGAFAQEEVINQGNMIINAGIGAGSWISHKDYSMKLFPVVGSFEYCVADLFDSRGAIGIGGYAAYAFFGSNDKNLSLNINNLILGARGLFHYEFVNNLDTYAGLALGFNITTYPNTNIDFKGKPYLGGFIGARYFITNNIGVFGELGYGISPLEVGVCYIF